MTDTDARWQQLRAMFSVELEERTRSLNHLLLGLEGVGEHREETGAEDPAAIFDALFREAHSIKGAARMVTLPQMEQLAHALETALQAVRDRGGRPEASWFDAAYRTVDMFGEINRRALEGQHEPPAAFEELLASLRGASAAPTPSAPVVPPVASESAAPETPRRNGSARAAPTPPPAPAPANGASNGAASREETPADRASARPSRTSSESVRVAVEKLDALLSQAGELAVTSIRIEQRLGELRELRRTMDAWQREWRAARALRRGLDHGVAGRSGTPDAAVSTATGRGTARGGVRSQPLEALLTFFDRAERDAQAVVEQLEAVATHLRSDAAQLGQVTHAIEDEVMAVRLLPAAAVFASFQRMIRDLGREHGKDVRLVTEGGDTEIDRKILEALRDPLMHLLRNAVDHGVEPADERVAHSKPPTATIRLVAAQRGGQIEIEVADDGRGIDPSQVRERAVARGMLLPEQAAALDDAAAAELIFRRGFSTRQTVTATSGRGVGMDVVREHVERLGGTVKVASAPGQGARFLLAVPLTLATTRAVLVEQNGQVCAIPSAAVERMGRVREADVLRLEGRRAVALEGRPVPLVELGGVLERPLSSGHAATEARPYVVLQHGERRLALLADRLIDEQEIVVKSLGWPLRRVRNVGGAAVLGSGQMALILNPADVLKSGLKLAGSGAAVMSAGAAPADEASASVRRRLLVVDDSLTTRTLVRSILETAGYDVAVAVDGADALRVLRSQPIDLVVSDLQMPNLDGFALTTEIRRDPRLRSVPVVLVTSLDAPEHRERGAAAGADAYIVKSAFDQAQLLDTIGRLL